MTLRFWIESDLLCPDGWQFTHEKGMWMEFYMDEIELGTRVSDYFHSNVGTIEEQLEEAVRREVVDA